ncbi:DUF2752 domain-containing protein [Emticicia fluvialis]|uniref:DUF2752 domain-containing protein n=1 Tax=Emticicia fluvialis TaxID=2974474 RepID=UPI0021669710|nr:DUF2752 domain-containing protein [Emticicia fluvialis]
MGSSSVKILLVVLAVAVTTYYFFYPSINFLPDFQCLFHRATGLYCLGCGGQRAFHALLHGHFAVAAQNNLLVFLVVPLVGLKFLEEITGRKIFPEFFYSRRFLLPLVVFVIFFTVLRNIPGPPFHYLAPAE